MTARTRFALGTFAACGGRPFPGLVLGERVADLRPRLGDGVSLRALIDDWDASLPRLREVAAGVAPEDAEHSFDALRPLPPLHPWGQVFCAGANFRQHVLDLMAGAERRGDSTDGLTAADRERARAALGERARSGRPFVFTASANAIVGARDDVVLPYDSEQHDWELELAAVIGRPPRRVPRERAPDGLAGASLCT